MATKQKQIDPEVLRFINVGRHALGMSDLRELPRGRRGDMRSHPLANAFDLEIGWEDDACPYCGCPTDANVVVEDDEKHAVALAKAWGTRIDFYDECLVQMPQALARFCQEFNDGLYPDLESRRAKVSGLSSEILDS